jgi:uncharacterized protein (TIGR02246 family)
MPDLEQVAEWVDRYVRAWNSNDPDDIGALFADDAAYFTEPFAMPWRGRQAIVDRWLGRKDQPGQTEFTWRPVAVTTDVAVVHGVTTYRTPPHTYSNLWVIRLDHEGRCTEFTEWWMEHPSVSDSFKTGGTPSP